MRRRRQPRPRVIRLVEAETKGGRTRSRGKAVDAKELPEFEFASTDTPRMPKKGSISKMVSKDADKAKAQAEMPEIEFADSDTPTVSKKRSMFKSLVKAAEKKAAAKAETKPKAEPDTAPKPDESDQEQPDAAPDAPRDKKTTKAKVPPPPQRLVPRTAPMGRAASFQAVVSRLQKRYRQLQTTAPKTEHIGVWSVITEDDPPQTPLFLMEEANYQQGIWISLWPSDKVQRRLARLGGVPPEEIHMTLVYVGRVDKTRHADVATLASVCERVAKQSRPFTGQVTGIGRFSSTTPEDLDTIYASFTSPRLDDLRTEILQQLTSAGLSYTRKYGFTPHMTLAKIPQRAISPLERIEPFRLRFSWLTLKVGNWRHKYKLGD